MQLGCKTLSLMLAVLSIGSTALAQVHRTEKDSMASQATHNLNPIVVTGSGHHQRLKSTATPVHVLSRQEISEQGIATFDAAITRMMPQVSMAPNSMGTFLRLNGLGNKYILILINGQKLSGDISNNVDLSRINMSRVKRIEVLDGAASSLYGSDAIAGVINIITDQPTGELVAVSSNTRVSGEGQLTQAVNLDIYHKGWGSYTTFTRDQADSYRNNSLEYVKGSDTETQTSIAPLFTGFRSNVLDQRFTFSPNEHFAMNAGIGFSYKITDRPNTRDDVAGGTDYEMRYKGLRWNVGGIYKIDRRNSFQADFTVDKFRYGKEYDVQTKNYEVGDYVQSKKQQSLEGEIKGIFHFFGTGSQWADATTIVGVDWRKDFLKATSGNISQNAAIMAVYAQHEQQLIANLTATVGMRYSHHETFGSHFTPKATLMYALGHLRFRATYSAGFRAPGLDELYYHYFSVNRGKPQIIFGNTDLKPEKSHYLAFNTEWRSKVLAVSLTGFVNRVNDMVVRQNIDVDERTLGMLQTEFPEMTSEQAGKLERYSLYQNSEQGLVQGVQVNVSANLFRGFNVTANYACNYTRTKSDQQWTVLERSIRNTATVAANYHYVVNRHYSFGVNLNGRFQSKTYYPDYEDAPGFGVVNLHTSHKFDVCKWATFEPSVGVDNIFDKVDRRIDSTNRKFALFSPGRMLVLALKVNLKT